MVRTPTGIMVCGFCSTGTHDLHRVAVRNGKNAPNPLHFCTCTNPSCVEQGKHRRCLDCGNREEQDVDAVTLSCIDRSACETRVQVAVNSNPAVQKIRAHQERGKMAKVQENQKAAETRQAAAPKVGKCLVTGKETKGGKFAPGMDARYVSLKVASVLNKEATEKQVLAEMDGHGLSDALKGKFTKGLTLAREKAAKAAEAAEAKKAADKADKSA